MTLEKAGDILRGLNLASRNEAKSRERASSANSVFALTPPPNTPATNPKKKKEPLRISAPRLGEIDAFGDQKIDIGFIAREFACLGLPHSDPGDLRVYRRKNGRFEFRVTADPDSFLPYGMYPRLLGAWVSTEAVRTRSRTVYLGKNLSHFLRDTLKLDVTGGKNGTITALKEQMWRFFNCKIAILENAVSGGSEGKAIRHMELASEVEVWWHPKADSPDGLFESRIELGEKFYEAIISHPVPIDWNTVNKLRKSPLAIDLYFWIVYRMKVLKDSQATISLWSNGGLAEQIGANYDLSHAQGRKDFRRKIIMALKKVQSYYPAAKIEVGDSTVTLIKSATHVPMKRLK